LKRLVASGRGDGRLPTGRLPRGIDGGLGGDDLDCHAEDAALVEESLLVGVLLLDRLQSKWQPGVASDLRVAGCSCSAHLTKFR
jgi:hypothetical protein